MTAKLKIEHWAIDRVLPYAKNARLHSDAQVAAVAKSIAEFGFVNPCLVDADGVLIAGHCRVLSAKSLSLETVPVIRLGHLTELQARALRLADNALPMQATWSNDLVTAELQSLKLEGYDIPLIGFPESQLRGWGVSLGTDSAQDPEAVPERPKKPVVRKGDLWVLGDHRLLCGDATSESDVATCLGDAKPHLMIVDPPYGVSYDPNWRNEANRWSGSNVKLGAAALGTVRNDNFADWTKAWKLFEGDVAYVWHAALMSAAVEVSLTAVNLIPRSNIIWNKTRGVIGRGDYHWQHEPCWYAVRKGKRGHWQGSRSQTTVWDIPKSQTSETGHGTQKPIECMKRPMENNSRKGDAVYDPFVGSGTTIIAAEMTGRKALAIEIDPTYVQVAIERWQTFTSKLATCDGKTLEQVAAARRKGKANGSKRKHPPLRANRKRDGLRDAGVDAAAEPGK